MSYAGLCKELTGWRNASKTDWLTDSPVHTYPAAGLKDLERSRSAQTSRPSRRKGSGDSFRYPDPEQMEVDSANGRIKLPKLGWIRYRKSQDALGEARNATVSYRAGKWYVSIQRAALSFLPVQKGGVTV